MTAIRYINIRTPLAGLWFDGDAIPVTNIWPVVVPPSPHNNIAIRMAFAQNTYKQPANTVGTALSRHKNTRTATLSDN